jgi:hypothetical protein
MKHRFLDHKLAAATAGLTPTELVAFNAQLLQIAKTLSAKGRIEIDAQLDPKLRAALCRLVLSEIADSDITNSHRPNLELLTPPVDWSPPDNGNN